MLKLFGRREEEQAGDGLSYEAQRELLQAQEPAMRASFARREDARPEMLYFLADDPSPEVRRAIAQNHATPAHADLLLAQDPDDEVRCEMARKIARLIPDLDEAARTRVRELALQALRRWRRTSFRASGRSSPRS